MTLGLLFQKVSPNALNMAHFCILMGALSVMIAKGWGKSGLWMINV